ncbi:MAG: hypothetical protein H0T12_07420, partial [Actinobacteria bacterium]|nr:hypothetical protein [Actinomycetota bacterium]
VLGFGYRVHRLAKGGPLADVTGQAVLGLLLGVLAVAVSLGAGWARWAALSYALLFGVVVMPVWVLAVLIPLPPARIDYLFTATYWLTLITIVISALLL